MQRVRTKLGLKGTRLQNITAGEFYPIYKQARQRFPAMGARAMVNYARRFYGRKISEYVFSLFFTLN